MSKCINEGNFNYWKKNEGKHVVFILVFQHIFHLIINHHSFIHL